MSEYNEIINRAMFERKPDIVVKRNVWNEIRIQALIENIPQSEGVIVAIIERSRLEQFTKALVLNGYVQANL